MKERNWVHLGKKTRLCAALCSFVLVLGLCSCDTLTGGGPSDDQVLDGPIQSLNNTQRLLHENGDHEFGRVFTAIDGLGPIFNAQSCEGCHIGDGKGHGLTTLTRFGRQTANGFDPMIEFGGPQLQDRALPGFSPEYLYLFNSTLLTSKFLPPSVTGLGYLEAIDDSTVLAHADPDDTNADGISGIASWIKAPEYVEMRPGMISRNSLNIGRFGRKAAAINLLHQTVNALINDMGLTSDFHIEDVQNVQEGNHSSDNVSDPELPGAKVHSIVFYLRTLKAPPRRDATNAVVMEGEKTFASIGCTSCHTATMQTGQSDIIALSGVTIHPYTDLLLHDMGAELNDGYTEGSATSGEWRTTPLWGLGLSARSTGGSPQYLHDGRATSLEQAIELHGGEATSSRSAYRKLSAAARTSLLRFLESL